ncbi:hypothetical protein ScPMuIL_003850 [Solemya velum]
MATKVKALQLWCKKMAEGYRDCEVKDFTTSWKSGLAFCAIIHRFRPDLIDYDSLSKENVFENNQLAFEVAEQELGIPAFLEAADMVRIRVPDRLSVITYVSQYSNYFGGKPQLGGPGVNKPVKKHHDSKASPKEKPLTSAQEKNKVRQESLGDKCVICDGKVYLLERQIENGKLYHRSCYRHSDLSPTSKVLKRPSVLSDDARHEKIAQSKARKLGEQQKPTNTDPEPDFWQRRAAAKQKEMANSCVTKMDTTEKRDTPSVTKNLNIGGEKSTVKERHDIEGIPHWKRSKPPDLSLAESNKNDLKNRKEPNIKENPFLSKDKLKPVNGIVDTGVKKNSHTNEQHNFKSHLSNLKPVGKKDEKHVMENAPPVPQARHFLKKDDKSDDRHFHKKDDRSENSHFHKKDDKSEDRHFFKKDDKSEDRHFHKKDDKSEDRHFHKKDDKSEDRHFHKKDDKSEDRHFFKKDDKSEDRLFHKKDDKSEDRHFHKKDDKSEDRHFHKKDDKSEDRHFFKKDDKSEDRLFHKKDDRSEVKEMRGLSDTNQSRLFPVPKPRGKSPDIENIDTTAPLNDDKIVIPIPTMRGGDKKKNNKTDAQGHRGDTRMDTNHEFKSPVFKHKNLAHGGTKSDKLCPDSPPPLPNSMPPLLPSTRPSESVSALPETDKHKLKHSKPENFEFSRNNKDRLQPHTRPHSSDHINKPSFSLAPPEKPPRLSAMDVDKSHLKPDRKIEHKQSSTVVSPADREESGDKTVLTGLLHSLANVRKHHDDQPVPETSKSQNQNEQSKPSSHFNLKDIKSKEPPNTGVLKHEREQINHPKEVHNPSALVRDGKLNSQTENSNTVLTHHREVITPKQPEVNKSKIKQDEKHVDKFQNESKDPEPMKTPLYRKKEQPNKKRNFLANTKTETSKPTENNSSHFREKDDMPLWRKDKTVGENKTSHPKSANVVFDSNQNTGKLPWQVEAEKRLAANKKGFVDPEIHIPHPKPREKIVNGHIEQKDPHHPLPSDQKKYPSAPHKNATDVKMGLMHKELGRPSNMHIPDVNFKNDRKVIPPPQPEEIKTPSNLKKKLPVTMKFSFTNSTSEDDTYKGEKPPRPPRSPVTPVFAPAGNLGLHKHEPPSRPPPLKTDLGRPRMSAYDLQRQLESIDCRLTSLELRGRQLEDKIRNADEEREDDLMINWFELVNEKNELVRQEADLVYSSREQELEDQQLNIDKRLRYLISIPEKEKTDADCKEEERLINQLLETVNQRSCIVESIDEDKLRYEQEDKDIADILKEKGYHRDSKSGLLLQKELVKVDSDSLPNTDWHLVILRIQMKRPNTKVSVKNAFQNIEIMDRTSSHPLKGQECRSPQVPGLGRSNFFVDLYDLVFVTTVWVRSGHILLNKGS